MTPLVIDQYLTGDTSRYRFRYSHPHSRQIVPRDQTRTVIAIHAGLIYSYD